MSINIRLACGGLVIVAVYLISGSVLVMKAGMWVGSLSTRTGLVIMLSMTYFIRNLFNNAFSVTQTI
jgi:hypothetical protein